MNESGGKSACDQAGLANASSAAVPSSAASVSLAFKDQTIELLADRAVFWPSESALFVADTHFGKADHFRGQGLPVPDGPTERDTARLTQLIRATSAEQLIVLGDLFHAAGSLSDEVIAALSRFRDRHPTLHWRLVRGNHDRHAGPPPDQLGIEACGERLVMDKLLGIHEPQIIEGSGVLAGHIHPAVRLSGGASGRRKAPGGTLRMACFHVAGGETDSPCLTLPAFGTFTGAAIIKPAAKDRVFAVAPDASLITEVTESLRR